MKRARTNSENKIIIQKDTQRTNDNTNDNSNGNGDDDGNGDDKFERVLMSLKPKEKKTKENIRSKKCIPAGEPRVSGS